MQCSLSIRQTKYSLNLFMAFLLFKTVLEFSYAVYLNDIAPSEWPLHFNPLKFIYGFFWFTMLFFGIAHNRKLASTFFLQFLLAFQIIPITVIYALTDESTLYYSVVCFSVAVCEWMVFHMKTIRSDTRIANIPQGRVMIGGLCLLVFFFLLYVYYKNGAPTLMALNIYDVYKLRSSGIYQIGKYAGYLQALLTTVVIPILLTRFMLDRRYVSVALLVVVEFVIYLYTGHKSQLFMLVLVIGTVFLAMRKNFAELFWRLYCGAISLVSLAVVFGVPFADHIYGLFVRRVLFVSAQNSFYHFDFFSSHPLLWIAGIFPRWLIDFSNPYEGMEPYVLQIGKIYHGTDTWANNGFLSEGFARFGLGGIILNLVLFAIVLKLIDGLQEKAGYEFAIGCCVNIIFGLGDGYLLQIFGYIGAWILFMILYQCCSSMVVCGVPRFNTRKYLPRLVLGRRT